MKSIDKLSIVDTGNGEGAARLSNYVTKLMATAPEMLKNVSGIDVNQLIQGLTQKTNIVKNQKENTEVIEPVLESNIYISGEERPEFPSREFGAFLIYKFKEEGRSEL